MLKNKRIALIGAGISGLILAKKLAKENQITIFDKSRGIGGRMTTRRTDLFHFDHGAQFFTATNDDFKNFCKQAEAADVITKWDCKIAQISSDKIQQISNQGEQLLYVAKPQMNNLCKYLTNDLNIYLGKQITSISRDKQKWSLQTQDETFTDFDYLILAIPSEQALNLLPAGFQYLDIVANIKMSGCFTLMLGFKERLDLSFEAANIKDSMLSWIAINSSKPDRPSNFSLVVNTSNQWADEHIEEELDSVKTQMLKALQKIINFDLDNIAFQNIHRWRYANCHKRDGEKSLFDKNLNLGICGDWLISGKVESAFLSGLDLYEEINKN